MIAIQNTYTSSYELVVDDDSAQRSLLSSFLTQCGVTVRTAASGTEALAALNAARPALLISDVRMPGMTGLELLDNVHGTFADLPVLLVTAHVDIRDAVKAIQKGAVDYLEKPIDLEELLAAVRRVLTVDVGTPPRHGVQRSLPEGIVMESPVMVRVLDEIALVAPSESRVLLTGESGTGKEIVADLIHRWSARAQKPFIKLNCAAIPETLLESELFGHKKGAFTGATEDHQGLFAQADGGTLLLDEIGEMAPALQAKLLRVTQDGTFTPVGAVTTLHSDVRLLAATNRDLEAQVAAGAFREDLYYRLNVMEIALPPLRERVEDILPIARKVAASLDHEKARFSPGAVSLLTAYTWPGNIRELHNVIERALLLSRGDVILAEHFSKRLIDSAGIQEEPAREHMVDIERAAILKALQDQDYHRTRTAEALGISRRALTYKLRAYRADGFDVDKPE